MKLLKKHLKWFWDRIGRDRLDSAAAHGAFFILISFLPFLALLITLMQRVHFAPGQSLIEAALAQLPQSAGDYIRELLPSPIASGGLLPVTVIMAAWPSSKGMQAIIKGLDHVFEDEEERGFLRLRAASLFYVILLAVALIVTGVVLVFGSTIYNSLLHHSPPFFATLLITFKSQAGFLLLFAFFTLLYTFLPRRKVRLVHNLIGAAFAAAAWVLFSYFFSLFVENFSNFSVYGGLATLVILMYWLFFCVYIIFLGAEVSMWLEEGEIQSDIKAVLPRRKGTKAEISKKRGNEKWR